MKLGAARSFAARAPSARTSNRAVSRDDGGDRPPSPPLIKVVPELASARVEERVERERQARADAKRRQHLHERDRDDALNAETAKKALIEYTKMQEAFVEGEDERRKLVRRSAERKREQADAEARWEQTRGSKVSIKRSNPPPKFHDVWDGLARRVERLAAEPDTRPKQLLPSGSASALLRPWTNLAVAAGRTRASVEEQRAERHLARATDRWPSNPHALFEPVNDYDEWKRQDACEESGRSQPHGSWRLRRRLTADAQLSVHEWWHELDLPPHARQAAVSQVAGPAQQHAAADGVDAHADGSDSADDDGGDDGGGGAAEAYRAEAEPGARAATPGEISIAIAAAHPKRRFRSSRTALFGRVCHAPRAVFANDHLRRPDTDAVDDEPTRPLTDRRVDKNATPTCRKMADWRPPGVQIVSPPTSPSRPSSRGRELASPSRRTPTSSSSSRRERASPGRRVSSRTEQTAPPPPPPDLDPRAGGRPADMWIERLQVGEFHAPMGDDTRAAAAALTNERRMDAKRFLGRRATDAGTVPGRKLRAAARVSHVTHVGAFDAHAALRDERAAVHAHAWEMSAPLWSSRARAFADGEALEVPEETGVEMAFSGSTTRRQPPPAQPSHAHRTADAADIELPWAAVRLADEYTQWQQGSDAHGFRRVAEASATRREPPPAHLLAQRAHRSASSKDANFAEVPWAAVRLVDEYAQRQQGSDAHGFPRVLEVHVHKDLSGPRGD